MVPRERVLAALRRQVPDRVPMYMEFTPPVVDKFHSITGSSDPADYFDLDIREVSFEPCKKVADFSMYLGELPPGSNVNEWGVGEVKGSGWSHFVDFVHPLQKAATAKEIEDYPFPDMTQEYRWQHIPKAVKRWHELGYAVRGLPPFYGGTVFETAWALRGLENLLVDFVQNRAMAGALLDRVTDISKGTATILAAAGVDVLVTGDDVGMQRTMMMSPSMWREWLKPRLASVIEAAKEANPEVLIFYHSCGYIEPIIPDLIEIGVDILNPVQPESMDPERIKKLYGNELAFWGTIGTQTTLPFGTPDEVRQEVKRMIETVGDGGGLLISPTHVIEPDVPWENIMAFVDAVKEY
ncbi:MAG: uroporphyrinogen decarboxylase family protein [Bacillota bacterium]|jgi:uroporphyrinogen decarboxylase